MPEIGIDSLRWLLFGAAVSTFVTFVRIIGVAFWSGGYRMEQKGTTCNSCIVESIQITKLNLIMLDMGIDNLCTLHVLSDKCFL